MSTIRLENLTHRFGEFLALDNVSLEIQDRNVVTIVGPSGCGKSTLLRIIAGLERPSSGTISIDGQVVNTVPTRFPNVGMGVQFYAVVPSKALFENPAPNLRIKKFPADEIEQR